MQLAAVGALVLVGVLVAAVTAGVSASHPPDGPVRELFAALTGRDATRVGQLVDCQPLALCSADALTRGYRPPDGLAVLGVDYGEPLPGDQTRRPNRNRAGVRISYTLGGGAHAETVELIREGTGLVRSWHIITAPGALLDIISTTTPTALLGGAQVDTVTAAATSTRTDGSLHALPGVYTLTAGETPLRAAVPSTVTVAGDLGRQHLTLEVTVKTGVRDAVDRQVRHRIDACAQVADLRPDVGGGLLRNCPYAATTRYTYVRRPRWAVLAYPTIEIRDDVTGAVTVRTTIPGRARVRYDYSLDVAEPRAWTPTTTDVAIDVGGEVEINGDTVTWTG